MKTLKKLKFQRAINRHSNGVVEQFEKLLARLTKWIEKLDAEQDAANAAMQAEISALRDNAEKEVERLENAIAEAKDNAERAEVLITDEYATIINESKAEADRAKQVQSNMQALVESPT